MNGTLKTFLNKNLAEKKLKQNYLLGSTTPNPKLSNQISTTDKASWKNIMTEKRCKPLSVDKSLVPFARHSTIYSNQLPATTPLTDFAKISNFLRATKSHVAAVVHDSVVIDLHRDDRRMIPQLQEMFSQTRLGHFKTNVSIGKNLGNMREFRW